MRKLIVLTVVAGTLALGAAQAQAFLLKPTSELVQRVVTATCTGDIPQLLGGTVPSCSQPVGTATAECEHEYLYRGGYRLCGLEIPAGETPVLVGCDSFSSTGSGYDTQRGGCGVKVGDHTLWCSDGRESYYGGEYPSPPNAYLLCVNGGPGSTPTKVPLGPPLPYLALPIVPNP